MSKPFYVADLAQLGEDHYPFTASLVTYDKPLAEHPNIYNIRNKRRRNRIIKRYKRMGITSFLSYRWEILGIQKS